MIGTPYCSYDEEADSYFLLECHDEDNLLRWDCGADSSCNCTEPWDDNNMPQNLMKLPTDECLGEDVLTCTRRPYDGNYIWFFGSEPCEDEEDKDDDRKCWIELYQNEADVPETVWALITLENTHDGEP
eukprot:UN03499